MGTLAYAPIAISPGVGPTPGRSLAFRAHIYADWERWHDENGGPSCANLSAMTRCFRAAPTPRSQNASTLATISESVWRSTTEPDITMPMYVLVPKQGTPPYPVVLAPHGHGGGGKAAVVGMDDDPEVAEAIATYNYAYGLEFVRAGFITFCPRRAWIWRTARGRRRRPDRGFIVPVHQPHGTAARPDGDRYVDLGPASVDRLCGDAGRLRCRTAGLRRPLGRRATNALGSRAG